MTKPIVERAVARQDVENAIDRYLGEAGERVAICFVDEIERAYARISEHPGSGSLRYSYELNLPGLRCLVVRTYPYMVCYRELEHRIDVWRVLHAKSDIPAWMAE